MARSSSRQIGLPARYQQEWGAEFWEFVNRAISPGARILDIGSGRQPTISPAARPDGTHYVGLDLSATELRAAPEGSYDEIVVADAEVCVPDLVGRFDVIVSWYVLEHVRHVDQAAAVFHRYAAPGGWFVACLAGRNAVFALANRILPPRLGAWLVSRLRDRPRESVFQTHYDHCTYRGLRRAFSPWDELHIVPLWHAADYFERLGWLRRPYLAYEDWAERHRMTSLCTHYVIAARRGS